MVEVLALGCAEEARARPWEEVQVEMMIGNTRDFVSFGVPARLLVATGAAFKGRAVSIDRQTVGLQGRTALSAGLRNPAGVVLGATPIPRGTSMI